MVVVTDVTKGTTLYSDFNLSGAGITWKTETVAGNLIDYTDWQLVDVAPGAAGIAMGDQVTLAIYASGCEPSAHWGEVYVDGVGATIPGLSVEGTAPGQANAGADLTYSFTYQNGSPKTACTTSANCPSATEACVGGFCAETGVVIDIPTPANTTFVSFVPPAGATCTTPAVGAAGTITCTFTNPVSAGAIGNFSLTVAIAAAATGQITCTNYEIASTQETALIGPTIVTSVGCTLDAQCPAGDWCDESKTDCVPTLSNGTPIPTDGPHTNPTLDGTCTAAAGALVCTSKVCDTKDNQCGYENGDGPCTPATGSTLCQSGACSTNDLCMPAGGCNVDADCTGGDWCDEATNTCTPKLANGQPMPNDPKHTNPTLGGTCTAAGATLVCVSGVCDPNGNVCGIKLGDGTCTTTPECITGVCVTMGANSGKCELCGSDANCAAPTPACDTTTNTCVQCTTTNTTACSGNTPICGATDTCVACNGDNGSTATSACPTTGNPYCAATGACTVCTSDAMCTTGTHPGPYCDTATGACTTACQTDAECGAGDWCNSFGGPGMCEPKLPNGQGVTGQACTPTLGMRACIAGVCDTTDNLCGYANGDGPCGGDAGSGATVCRSGACSTNGTCEPAGGCNVDADCSAGHWCNEGAHMCEAQLPNGTAVPSDPTHTNPALNGTCTPAAGTLVCQSGVCDTADNKCGFANGDGQCTGGDAGDGATVCRSGVCATTGTHSGVCEACSVNSDCPSGQVCSANNTCVVAGTDAGAVDAGGDAAPGVDSGAIDSGSGGSDASTSDSSTSADAAPGEDGAADASEDATSSGADASNSGVVEGGGCSSAGAQPTRGGLPAGLLGGLSIVVVLAARRRRARQQASQAS
jgi:Cys-rich repeat protein